MKVLIISANTLSLSSSGPAYIAGAARDAGCMVEVFDCLFAQDPVREDDARKDGQLKDDKELFEGVNYITPKLPKEYMIELIESLRAKKNYTVQVNKPYAEYRRRKFQAGAL